MKAAASLSVLAFIATSALATDLNQRANVGISPVHARLHVAHSKMRRQANGKVFKRCKAHNKSESSSAPAATSYAAPAPSSTSYQAPATSSAPSSGGGGGSSGDVINVKTSGCGDIGAVAKTTQNAGPNGSEGWLTCGVESGGGWNPPNVQVSDLKYKDLAFDGIFKPCAQFSDIIYNAAGAYSLPPIMIASIMMQESSCNKATVGGGGEQGLMQITKDKCGGAPGGNCMDPDFNIHTGAKYLAGQISSSGNNVLLAVGSYNGWYDGLTYAKATAAAKSSCCRCQNNLDYVHQFFNGWMQGIDAYSSNLGTYKNLDQCGAY